jgi:hypothetical protein
MSGIANAEDSQSAYTLGAPEVTSSQSAYMSGFGGDTTSAVSAYTSGGLGITDIIRLESTAPLKLEVDSLVTQTLSIDSTVNTSISRDSEL